MAHLKIGKSRIEVVGSFLDSYNNYSIDWLRSSCWVLTKYRHSEPADYIPWVKRPELRQFLTSKAAGLWHPRGKSRSIARLKKIFTLKMVQMHQHLENMEWSEHCLLCVCQLLFGAGCHDGRKVLCPRHFFQTHASPHFILTRLHVMTMTAKMFWATDVDEWFKQ